MPPFVINDPKSLNEFVGREFPVTEWFTVSQERIALFAEATEDRQWIHLDRAKATNESPFGRTIAHGFLTLSLISHFLKSTIQIQSGVRLAVNYGLNRVRFPTAVRADSKIRARVALQDLNQQPDWLEAIYAVTVEGEQATKPCCIAEWIVRYYS